MDNAFATAPYPSLTTARLHEIVSAGEGNDIMVMEIARRAAVAAGDYSLATAGERLRRAAVIIDLLRAARSSANLQESHDPR